MWVFFFFYTSHVRRCNVQRPIIYSSIIYIHNVVPVSFSKPIILLQQDSKVTNISILAIFVQVV